MIGAQLTAALPTRLLPRAGSPASRSAMTCAWQIYLIPRGPHRLACGAKALSVLSFRSFSSFFQFPDISKYIEADIFKIMMDIIVEIPYRSYPLLIEILLTPRIIFLARYLIMLTSVELYRKLYRSTVEIDDIPPDHLLTIEVLLAVFKKIIPQFSFFRGHIFPKLPGIVCQLPVIQAIHDIIPHSIIPR